MIKNLIDKQNIKFNKLMWGIKVVGVWPTMRGMFKFALLTFVRPKRSELRLKSGRILNFAYPSQLPTALLIFGDYIDPEFSFLKQISNENLIFADVGAAIGQFTIFAANFPFATVHAFEPSATNVASLRINITRNNIDDKVIIHKKALSDIEGDGEFLTTSKTWMSGLASWAGDETEIVPVRTLTAEFDRMGLEHVSVLKINVAGHEAGVIDGAKHYLLKGKVDILIMLLGLESMSRYKQIFDMGYRFFYYHPIKSTLYELKYFDEDHVLNHRPWPARHIIAIYKDAVEPLLGDRIKIQQLMTG